MKKRANINRTRIKMREKGRVKYIERDRKKGERKQRERER